MIDKYYFFSGSDETLKYNILSRNEKNIYYIKKEEDFYKLILLNLKKLNETNYINNFIKQLDEQEQVFKNESIDYDKKNYFKIIFYGNIVVNPKLDDDENIIDFNIFYIKGMIT